LAKSDKDLVGLAQSGSLEAFDELMFIHQARIFALAYRMLGNSEDAADVQQETFVRAWKSLNKFRKDAEFTTWLHRIAMNICLSMRKRQKLISFEPLYEDSIQCSSESVESGVIATMQSAETALYVRKVMAAMPAHQKALLVLREIEGRCFEEIAQILGCSEQSARSRACRARMLLRERLQPYLEEELQ
jgi:RNA polymerase sigma-70 factor (ECF subfamily)